MQNQCMEGKKKTNASAMYEKHNLTEGHEISVKLWQQLQFVKKCLECGAAQNTKPWSDAGSGE